MNTTKILASSLIALASVAAGNAFADSYDRGYPVITSSSNLSRAQVRDALVQAHNDGSLAAINDDKKYPVIADSRPAKTFGEVRAELIQAQKDGSIPKYHGSDRI
ncbi:DUF4148 domain-containing protein [Rhodoferax sp.]|uniref:DUF4148 domain-containing protein n=1 Tax=Rhodoferax sp. TaxID=50421 RepID=UPI00374C9845